jgi:Coenzyme PQQ synthesis protein D (PqqD)
MSTERKLPQAAMSSDSRQSISPNSIVAAARDQIWCDLAGEAAILNLKSGMYFGLDEVGAEVWSLVAEPRRVSEIRDVLLEHYDVDPARCADDLMALLGDLVEQGLLEVTNEPSR